MSCATFRLTSWNVESYLEMYIYIHILYIYMYTVIPLISTISEDAQVNRRFLSLCEFIFDLQDDVFFFWVEADFFGYTTNSGLQNI